MSTPQQPSVAPLSSASPFQSHTLFWGAHEQIGLLPLDLRLEHLMRHLLTRCHAERVTLYLYTPPSREVPCARLGQDGALETSLRGDRLKGKRADLPPPSPGVVTTREIEGRLAVLGQAGHPSAGAPCPQEDEARADAPALLVLVEGVEAERAEEAAQALGALLPGMRLLERRLLWSHGLLPGQAALAARERATLDLMLGGLSEREIGEALGVTAASAHQYVLRVNRKLGVSSRAQLLHAWMTDGLPDDPPRHERPTSADARAAELERFWRTLSQRAPYPVRDYLRHVFRALCALFDAANVSLVPAVHLDTLPEDDPMSGWRAHAYIPFVTNAQESAYAQEVQNTEVYAAEPRLQLIAARAGKRRVYLASELAQHLNLSSARLRELQKELEITDCLIGVLPLSETNELYLCHDRLFDTPLFDAHDRALMMELLPYLGAFARRLFLLYGVLPGQQALTPRERETLEHLLGGLNEREVAEALGVAQSAAHQYIQDVYAKLGCTSKNTLLRWWLNPVASLGQASGWPAGPHPPLSTEATSA